MAEQPEDTSVRAELEKAFAEAETPPAEPTSPPAPTPEPGVPHEAGPAAPPGERPRDEKGRFLPEKKLADETAGLPVSSPVSPPPVETTAESKPDPLSGMGMTKGDMEMFRALPEAAQKFLSRRYREMDTGRQQKETALAGLRDYEPVAEMFAPYQGQLKAAGLTAAQVIQRWASAEQALQQDARGTLIRLAQMYGVDPKELAGEAPQQAAATAQNAGPSWLEGDPVVQQLRSQVAQAQAHIQQFTQGQAEAQIQSFADMRDAKGALAHPYFEKVVDEMIALTRGERASGRAPDLEAIYQKACRANDEIYQELSAAQRDAAAKDYERRAREKAAAAGKAGISVGSGAPLPGGDSSAELPIGDLLRRNWEEQAGA
ncbi:MAG: hypothetical protein ACREEP_08235 [Dongiaceae bacterium]